MRTSLVLLSIFAALNFCISGAAPIQKRYISHIERVSTSQTTFSNNGVSGKSDRLSNTSGDIILIYDESLPDSIKTAFAAAKKIWESKLPPTKQPIYIIILFEPLGSDISIVSDALYIEAPEYLGCPSALASQLLDSSYGSIDSPDGYIRFNSELDWNCRFSKDEASTYNLPTMALRGIARCLGFGSSIMEDFPNQFFYPFGWPTYFDKLLFCNGTNLVTLEEGSLSMAEFIRSDNVYAHTGTNSYKIFAPNGFIQDISLCYFDEDSSLMSRYLGQGSVNLTIDNKTTDVLRAIGWNFPTSGLKILCNNIAEDGIGSSYDSHTFNLAKEDEDITNYNWRFFLKNSSGEYDLVSTGTNELFKIEPILNTQNLLVNVNGDLEGRIECDYTTGDNSCYSTSISISLELKPVIDSIDNISCIKNSQYEFYMTFNVNYRGADNISIEIEEEYNSILRNYRFDEPYIAHIKTGNITNLYYSWVTIIASNKYGKVYETIENEPTYGYYNANNASLSFDKSTESNIIHSVCIYELDGNLLFDGTLTQYNSINFSKGLYLKKEIYEDGSIKTKKILIQ